MTKNNPEEIASKIHKISRIDKSKYSIPLSQAKSHFKWENQVETLKSIIKNI
jgi:hypothetical protein